MADQTQPAGDGGGMPEGMFRNVAQLSPHGIHDLQPEGPSSNAPTSMTSTPSRSRPVKSDPAQHDLDCGSDDSEGYDYIFSPCADKKYECPVCLMILRNPMQTECGHRFCKVCIKKWKRSQTRVPCPVCHEALHDSQIYPDNFAKREILALTVLCPNTDDGCSKLIALGQLERHRKECEFVRAACPTQCGSRLLLGDLSAHMLSDCTRRQVECTFCHGRIRYDEREQHVLECAEMETVCSCCQKTFLVRELEFHKDHECLKMQICCFYKPFGCEEEFAREDQQEHLQSSVEQHLQLVSLWILSHRCTPKAYDVGRLPLLPAHPSQASILLEQEPPPAEPRLGQSSDYTTLSSGYATTTDLSSVYSVPPAPLMAVASEASRLAGYKGQGSQTHSDPCWWTSPVTEKEIEDRNSNQREQLRDSKIERLQALLQEQEQKMRKYEHMFKHFEMRISEHETRNCNGVYMWKLKEYSRKRQDAVSGRVSTVHSPGFYTSYYGYKLCMRINLNGVESAFGTHLSLFVHFMRGEYDNLLEWPFQGQISLLVLDQRDEKSKRQDITETLDGKPGLLAFQRPASSKNHKGFGYIEFAPVSLIEKGQYVKNDTLWIKAVVQENRSKEAI